MFFKREFREIRVQPQTSVSEWYGTSSMRGGHAKAVEIEMQQQQAEALANFATTTSADRQAVAEMSISNLTLKNELRAATETIAMDSSATACLSADVVVAKFASASACCCCISISTALACPPLMLLVPYPSDAAVRGWTMISLNSLLKNIFKASHVFPAVSFLRHSLTPS